LRFPFLAEHPLNSYYQSSFLTLGRNLSFFPGAQKGPFFPNSSSPWSGARLFPPEKRPRFILRSCPVCATRLPMLNPPKKRGFALFLHRPMSLRTLFSDVRLVSGPPFLATFPVPLAPGNFPAFFPTLDARRRISEYA